MSLSPMRLSQRGAGAEVRPQAGHREKSAAGAEGCCKPGRIAGALGNERIAGLSRNPLDDGKRSVTQAADQKKDEVRRGDWLEDATDSVFERTQDISASVRGEVMRVLLTRSSVAPKTLCAPAPSRDEILGLIAVGVTAPDHEALRPWRFILIEGQGRLELAQAFLQIRKKVRGRVSQQELARTWRKTMRAPTLVGVVARLVKDHPKVPVQEQYISVGAAIQGIMLAAHALGYGAIMLSGNRSRHPLARELLHLADSEEMVGFISIGTPTKHILPKCRPLPSAHLEVWGGRELTDEAARIRLNRS